MEKWAAEAFVFSEWKGRGINVLKSTGTIVEELEEAQVCLPVGIRVLHSLSRDRLMCFLEILPVDRNNP